MPVLCALAAGVSDSLNLAERYALVKCARRSVSSLAQAHDFSCETLGGTNYGSIEEGCLSAVATGRAVTLDQCGAERDVCDGIDGRHGSGARSGNKGTSSMNSTRGMRSVHARGAARALKRTGATPYLSPPAISRAQAPERPPPRSIRPRAAFRLRAPRRLRGSAR